MNFLCLLFSKGSRMSLLNILNLFLSLCLHSPLSHTHLLLIYITPRGSPVWWLWEETHVPKVVGSNPGTVYWMDMTFFTLICCKKCIDCLKRPKINEQEAGIGPLLYHSHKKPFLLLSQCLPFFTYSVSLSKTNKVSF